MKAFCYGLRPRKNHPEAQPREKDMDLIKLTAVKKFHGFGIYSDATESVWINPEKIIYVCRVPNDALGGMMVTEVYLNGAVLYHVKEEPEYIYNFLKRR